MIVQSFVSQSGLRPVSCRHGADGPGVPGGMDILGPLLAVGICRPQYLYLGTQ